MPAPPAPVNTVNVQDWKKFPVLSGHFDGIRVRCLPKYEGAYDNLKAQAHAGNYWAQMVVNGIKGLKAGVLHLDNVFVNYNGSSKMNGVFILTLPGCLAKFEKRHGEFWLTELYPSKDYFEQQAAGKKPGLHRAVWSEEQVSWDTEFEESGKIKNNKQRHVAITDRRGDKPTDTLNQACSYIFEAPISHPEKDLQGPEAGLDMHYTPGEKRIGGLRNWRQARKPQSSAGLHESAVLLAKTMFEARNVKQVKWIAEHGGAGVLIQAMNILVNQGVKMETHEVYFSRPTVNTNMAVELIKKLGMEPARNLSHHKIYKLDQFGAGLAFGADIFAAPVHRKIKDGSYNYYNMLGDWYSGAKRLQGASAPIAGITSIGVAMTQGVGSPLAIATIVGAIALTAWKSGPDLAEMLLPEKKFNQLKQKF